MRACEWQPTGPRASRALAALRAAERVSATAVPSSTLARPSRRRTKPCGAPRPKRSGHVRRAPRRGQSPRSRPKRPPGQNPELTKPPNGPPKASSRPATPHRSNAPTLQRSNAPTLQRSNAPTLQRSNAPTRQSRVRTTAPGAPTNAPKLPSPAPTNAPEPSMPPRKRLTDALSNFQPLPRPPSPRPAARVSNRGASAPAFGDAAQRKGLPRPYPAMTAPVRGPY